jgi:hypothetical protein
MAVIAAVTRLIVLLIALDGRRISVPPMVLIVNEIEALFSLATKYSYVIDSLVPHFLDIE